MLPLGALLGGPCLFHEEVYFIDDYAMLCYAMSMPGFRVDGIDMNMG